MCCSPKVPKVHLGKERRSNGASRGPKSERPCNQHHIVVGFSNQHADPESGDPVLALEGPTRRRHSGANPHHVTAPTPSSIGRPLTCVRNLTGSPSVARTSDLSTAFPCSKPKSLLLPEVADIARRWCRLFQDRDRRRPDSAPTLSIIVDCSFGLLPSSSMIAARARDT